MYDPTIPLDRLSVKEVDTLLRALTPEQRVKVQAWCDQVSARLGLHNGPIPRKRKNK